MLLDGLRRVQNSLFFNLSSMNDEVNKKHLTMTIDHENGIKYIVLNDHKTKYSASISDEGTKILDQRGSDIVLDFDENDQLVGIELVGF